MMQCPRNQFLAGTCGTSHQRSLEVWRRAANSREDLQASGDYGSRFLQTDKLRPVLDPNSTFCGVYLLRPLDPQFDHEAFQ
jgi:hypothetical protein